MRPPMDFLSWRVMSEVARDLLRFIDRSPTPYHAVAESVRRLEAAGFRALREEESGASSPTRAATWCAARARWSPSRRGGSRAGRGGLPLVGAHTDSPNLR